MSTAPQQHQVPTPLQIFETLNAYQRTQALHAAIELDLFTAIGEGNTTADAVATRIHASQRGTRILCDYLTTIRLLTKDGNNYGLTMDSATFLDRRSPAYLGTISRFLNPMSGQFDDIAGLVRKGGTLQGEEGAMEPENPLWVEFARSMAPLMHKPSELIAKMIGSENKPDWKVLDIAAGHGLFGIAVATMNPNARIVAQDWANVLAVAVENAAQRGLSDRYSTIPGSAFDVDFGGGYDVVLLTNFLHHFDIPTNESLLKKIYASMRPGAQMVTLEFIPNEDRVSPVVDAQFSLMMLGATRAGDAYTFAELSGMMRNAGFARNELHELNPLPQRVIVSYK